MPTIDPMMKIYPDTIYGVEAMLAEHCTLDIKGATYQADPQVLGVWLITLDIEDPKVGQEVDIIVYLAGYPDPWGDKREHNDFECGCHYPDEPAQTELERALGL